MTPKQEAKLVSKLSPKARKLYERIRSGNYFYDPYGARPLPFAIGELVANGLVRYGARVKVIQVYVVPHDYKPFRFERWRGHNDTFPKRQRRTARVQKAGFSA